MKFRVTWTGIGGKPSVHIVSEDEVKELCNTLIVNRYVFMVAPLPVYH